MFGVDKKGEYIRLKIDNEFYKEYIKKFGVESVKNYFKHFTYQQVKRFTENIIYWIERIPKQIENIQKASDLIVSMKEFKSNDLNFNQVKGDNKTKMLNFSTKDDTETYVRWEISTGKLRTLIERIKNTEFEKEVISNVYKKYPEYVSICRSLRELALMNSIMS